MAFNGNNMTPIGGNARAGDNSSNRNAPMGWGYQSKTDDLDTILSTGYFDTFHQFLSAGQFIYVTLPDQNAFVTIRSVDNLLKQVVVDGNVISAGFVASRIEGTDISSNGSTILAVIDTSAPRTVTILSADIIKTGQLYIIKDESGGAGTNNITIVPEGSETIDGGPNVVITVDHGVARLYSGAGNLFSF